MDVDRVAGEVDARIVYCGPPGAGKTANLKQLHRTLSPGTRGQLITSVADTDRAVAFDFLSVDLGAIHGLRARLHLYALPSDAGGEGRDRLLEMADGVVLVADSGADRLEEDRTALGRLEEGLDEVGRGLDELAFVLQYNKRDLEDALPVDRLEEALNPRGAPHVEAVVTRGEGVVETAEEVGAGVLRGLEASEEAS